MSTPKKRPRGRPKGSGTGPGAPKNAVIFRGQRGEEVPVTRMLLSMPDSTIEKGRRQAKLARLSLSGLLACLIEGHPDPRTHIPAIQHKMLEPVPEDAMGVPLRLWLPMALGDKLLRLLAWHGWDADTFFAWMIQNTPEPQALVPGKVARPVFIDQPKASGG